MIIPPPASCELSKLSIVYDVPYVAMQDKNDCWLAVLRMMHKFLSPQNPSYELKLGDNEKEEKNGVDIEQQDQLMKANSFIALEEGHDVFKTASDLFVVLMQRGPIITRIEIDELMLHAVVVAGVSEGNIYIMNPASNFVSATLRNEVPFLERQKALEKELQALSTPLESLPEWEKKNLGRLQGGGGSSRQGSPESSPLMARKHPSATGLASPQSSPPKSPVESPRHSPTVSPILQRRASSGSTDSESSQGGTSDDLVAQLTQALSKSRIGSQQRARDIKEQYLEEQQKHLHKRRALALEQFKGKLPKVARAWVAG